MQFCSNNKAVDAAATEGGKQEENIGKFLFYQRFSGLIKNAEGTDDNKETSDVVI